MGLYNRRARPPNCQTLFLFGLGASESPSSAYTRTISQEESLGFPLAPGHHQSEAMAFASKFLSECNIERQD